MLSGIATRVGQRMGLHRESATSSLSVLEAEIRRRLWWQILTLEGHSSSLSGHATSIAEANTPAAVISLRPSRLLNVNDSDLYPNMREPPLEHTGITEMLFCCIRYEVGKFMWSHVLSSNAETNSITTKIKDIDDFETRLGQQYIQYCDPSIPLHFLATLIVRTATCKMRLRAYAPHHYSTSAAQPQAEKDAAFAISLQIIEYDNQAHSITAQNMLKGFMWHVRMLFQLEAFIYILFELRVRTTGEQVDWAWQQVEACYEYHSEILRETKNKLWFAVGNLCLKAWEERVRAKRVEQGGLHLNWPGFVRELYTQRRQKEQGGAKGGGQEMGTSMQEPSSDRPMDMQMGQENRGLGGWAEGIGSDTMQPSTYMAFEAGIAGSMDWESWQTLFDDCGVPIFS